MIIQPNEKMAVFYAYCNKTEKDWKQCTLRYKLNDAQQWITITDTTYPFEFDVTLPKTNDTVLFEITAVKNDGQTITYPSKKINN
jgi:hypothetical protein